MDRTELAPGDIIRDQWGWVGAVVATTPTLTWADGTGPLRVAVRWHEKPAGEDQEWDVRIDELARWLPPGRRSSRSGVCAEWLDHAPKDGEPWWIVDGRRHGIARCERCGSPGIAANPRAPVVSSLEVAVTADDDPICHGCLFRELNLSTLADMEVLHFAPSDYTNRICHCPPCLARIDVEIPEAHDMGES